MLTDFLLARYNEDEVNAASERDRADLEARRSVVQYTVDRGVNRMGGNQQILGALEEVLKRLAVPYAGHPEYRRDEWRPT